VIRDSEGKILGLLAGFLGETTNNVAELTGLSRGLQAAMDKEYRNIVLEGDSQVIIRLIAKILNGSHPSKISPSWRLSGMLEDFKRLLTPTLTIIPSHVKRDANRVADCLANEAVEKEADYSWWVDHDSERPGLVTRCQTLATRDLPPPDGVTRGQQGTRGLPPGRSFMASTGERPSAINAQGLAPATSI
jgi:ribonuclease HI